MSEEVYNYVIYRLGGARMSLATRAVSGGARLRAPVLRIRGARPVSGEVLDFGPEDFLPNGMRAADVVHALISSGRPLAGHGGWCPGDISSPRVRAAARAFLAQWPEGPQLPQGGPG